MEKIQETENTIEVFENDIAEALACFCEEQGIDDLTKESQARWNAALMYTRKRVFPDKSILKAKNNYNNTNSIMNSTFNSLNYDLLNDICDIYIYLCMMYDKEVSIIGYSLLTGINSENIHSWLTNGTKSSTKSTELAKKLSKYREESLSDKLATANKNPVGILAILNRHYQWNLPGVSKETRKEVVGISETTRDTLARLAQRPPEMIESERNGTETGE